MCIHLPSTDCRVLTPEIDNAAGNGNKDNVRRTLSIWGYGKAAFRRKTPHAIAPRLWEGNTC